MTNDVRASRVLKEDMDALKAHIEWAEKDTVECGDEWDASEMAYTVLWWLDYTGYDVIKSHWVWGKRLFRRGKGSWIRVFGVDDQSKALGVKVIVPDFDRTLAVSLRAGRYVVCVGVTV